LPPHPADEELVHLVDQAGKLLPLLRAPLVVPGQRRPRCRVAAGVVGGDAVALEKPARGDCPGRKSPKWAVKRPARPYKSPIQNRFS
jgi:hypothetical protein